MRMFVMVFAVFIFFPDIGEAIDIATEHTQILNYIELITENLRQLQSLENQIEMIKNQVEGLKSVANYQNNFGDIDELRNNLTNITFQGTILSNQTQEIVDQMQQLVSTMPAHGTLTDNQESLDQGAINIVQNALNRSAQIRQSYQQQVNSLNALMDKNNQAVGQTQSIQTSNEIAAQSIAQTQSTQELLSEQISIQAAMMSKQLQEEKEEDERMKQIFNASDDGSSIFGLRNESS